MDEFKKLYIEKIFRNIAHEVKNPLTAIKGYTDLLGLKSSDDYTKKTVATIQDQIEEILARFDHIYSILNLKKGKPTAVSVHKMWYDTITELDIHVTTIFNSADLIIDTDASLFQEILRTVLGAPNRDYFPDLEIICKAENEFTYELTYPKISIDAEEFSTIDLPYSTKSLFSGGYEYYKISYIADLLGFTIQFFNEPCFGITLGFA